MRWAKTSNQVNTFIWIRIIPGSHTKGGFAMQCDKNDYRSGITGLEGVTGKKAVNSGAMTLKN
jgi:hypothetical protein